MQGGAIEAGLFSGKEDAVDKANLWAGAQKEFWQRIGDGENSSTVVDDIVARYSKSTPHPGNLPIPRGGPVVDAKSVNERAMGLIKRVQSGELKPSSDEYQIELGVLARWREHFDEEERRASLSKSVKPSGEEKLNRTR